MNRDRMKGKLEKAKGDVKQRIGGATRDRSTELEGWAEEQKGRIREGVGEAREDLERERRRDEPERP